MRISSKKRFTHGLFLADFKHRPRGTCGVVSLFCYFCIVYERGVSASRSGFSTVLGSAE